MFFSCYFVFKFVMWRLLRTKAYPPNSLIPNFNLKPGSLTRILTINKTIINYTLPTEQECGSFVCDN